MVTKGEPLLVPLVLPGHVVVHLGLGLAGLLLLLLMILLRLRLVLSITSRAVLVGLAIAAATLVVVCILTTIRIAHGRVEPITVAGAGTISSGVNARRGAAGQGRRGSRDPRYLDGRGAFAVVDTGDLAVLEAVVERLGLLAVAEAEVRYGGRGLDLGDAFAEGLGILVSWFV